MKTLQAVADLVESQAWWLIGMGRVSLPDLEHAVDWIDLHLGTLFLGFVLDRYAELVSAGQGL